MAQEINGGAVVHGAGGNVEGEAGDLLREEEPKVVAKVGTHDAELVGGGEDEDSADGVEDSAGTEGIEVVGLAKVELGLGVHSYLEEVVARHADGEDDAGKEVHSYLAVPAEDFGESAVLVLVSGGDVPEERVEDNVPGREPEQLVSEVDVLAVHILVCVDINLYLNN